MRRLVLALGLALFSLPTHVFGAPIRWTLRDVRFSDGGTATGRIVIDLDLLRSQSEDGSSRLHIDDIAVTTKGGSDAFSTKTYRDGEALFAEYLESSSDVLGVYGLIALRSSLEPSNPRVLLLYLASPLSGAGGVIPIVISNRQGLSGEFRGNVLSAQRTIVGGHLAGSPVSIPEPSVMALLAVAGSYGAFRRKRPQRPS
jgi:hypothetical protein